jgi:hypothetical protein
MSNEVEKAREESMRIIEYLADRYDMSHCEPEAIRDLLAVIDDLLAVRAEREAIIRAEADVSAKELLLIYAKTPVDRGRIRISVDLQDELQCNLDRARAELERLKGTVRE